MLFTLRALYAGLGLGATSAATVLTALCVDGKFTALELVAVIVAFVLPIVAAFVHPSGATPCNAGTEPTR